MHEWIKQFHSLITTSPSHIADNLPEMLTSNFKLSMLLSASLAINLVGAHLATCNLLQRSCQNDWNWLWLTLEFSGCLLSPAPALFTTGTISLLTVLAVFLVISFLFALPSLNEWALGLPGPPDGLPVKEW